MIEGFYYIRLLDTLLSVAIRGFDETTDKTKLMLATFIRELRYKLRCSADSLQ